MKKAIFRNFTIILSVALILSGIIFGVSISNIIQERAEEDLLYSLKIADHSIDYDGDLKDQIERLKGVEGKEHTRFTVIDLKGNVVADSEIDNAVSMKNHGNREEIKEALQSGAGFARRKSETLNVSMLYVAAISANESYILRVAVPFSGIEQYFFLLLPAILISIVLTLLIATILANRFAGSVTEPVNEIAEEMLKLNEDNPEFHFDHYQYDEMNVIAETTLAMSEAVGESKKQIDFERMVRQEFFANASHELKTPITSVRGYVELLENDMAADGEMKKEFLSRIKRETINMTNLINDILMISRLETKEVEVVLSQVRICPLLGEVCATLKPLAAECKVTISTNCRPVEIKANLEHIRELFTNLITNAIKYNKTDGKVKITVTMESHEMVLIIEDTGVGIPEEEQQRVF
ncbi:MAG: HAMP domain-containing sensor histidine kinase, partial [Mobilitalea sp.]